MLTIPELITENQKRWQVCEIVPERSKQIGLIAGMLIREYAKTIYTEIFSVTTVPWWVIAVIHEREASQNFMCNIAQGDPWSRISTHVPKGRGPFSGFIPAAVDALRNCAPKAAAWKDWSAGGTLTLLEEYNGLGYEDYHKEASPYNWGATNQEEWGKYTNDGHWEHVWDQQIGCAAMLKVMEQMDTSIIIK